MRGRSRATAALAAAVACAGLAVAGCGDSDEADEPAASAPPPATTPATTAPATTAPTETAPVVPGRVAAGKVVFVRSCDTCHAGLGTRKYVGPKLSGLGLTAATIRTTVVQGRSPMPAGLVEGQELADVVAFVRSIQ